MKFQVPNEEDKQANGCKHSSLEGALLPVHYSTTNEISIQFVGQHSSTQKRDRATNIAGLLCLIKKKDNLCKTQGALVRVMSLYTGTLHKQLLD